MEDDMRRFAFGHSNVVNGMNWPKKTGEGFEKIYVCFYRFGTFICLK